MPRKKIVEGYSHPIERTKLYDVPAIEFAKSIIDRDPASHIHIPMLADKAGINEFKLKIGFRELFQTSPYKIPSPPMPRKRPKPFWKTPMIPSIRLPVRSGSTPTLGSVPPLKKHTILLPLNTATGSRPKSISYGTLARITLGSTGHPVQHMALRIHRTLA